MRSRTRAVACWFEQRSSRSRVALEVAIHRLGGRPSCSRPTSWSSAPATRSPTPRAVFGLLRRDRVRHPLDRDVLELAEHSRCRHRRALRERVSVPGALRLLDAARALRRPGRAQVATSATPPRRLDPLADRGGDALGRRAARRRADDAGADPALLRPRGNGGAAVRGRARGGRRLRAWCCAGTEAHAEVIDGRLSLAGEQVANLLPVTQAVLRALVTGDWEL